MALAFGLDVAITRNSVRWVQKDWNAKGDASKTGKIALVEDLQEADVVLVRYPRRNTQAGESTAAAAVAGGVWAAGQASTEGLVPVQAYIMKRSASGYDDVLGDFDRLTFLRPAACPK